MKNYEVIRLYWNGDLSLADTYLSNMLMKHNIRATANSYHAILRMLEQGIEVEGIIYKTKELVHYSPLINNKP